MAHLTLVSPDGTTRTIPLVKKITTIGSGRDNDLRIDDGQIPTDAIHIVFDGVRYQVGSHGIPFLINGKHKDAHILEEEDRIRLGESELVFGVDPQSAEKNAKPGQAEVFRELNALRRLTQFSERLFATYDLNQLLEKLMDEVIELTRADKGFLILMENNEPKIKVARNLARENIEDAIERVSDSIVAKVVRSQKPLIISDALDDPEFRASESVVNLKLLSVMSVPLMHGGTLFGVIYVGNDRLANRFDPRSLDTLTVFAAQASLILQNAMLVNDLKLDNTELRKQLETHRYGEIVGTCQSMRDVYRQISKIAPTDISVLITGETGTGKELIAMEIHRRSQRAKGPFVTINCGAIPENLLESELFGHVKGAFTGAVTTKVGKFQAAIGGTLFLDEIGELPLALQVKLLRALEEKVVYKVGENRGDPVDIRVVAATNKVLQEEVAKSTFREDLYYRLNVVTLQLPPLRQRGEDIALLAKYFLQKYAAEFNSTVRSFSPNAIAALKRYGWPGNIRELENRIKKAAVLAERTIVGPKDLDLKPEFFDAVVPLAQAKEEFEARYIMEVLERNSGNKTKTAKDLGVDPRTVFRHLKKQGGENSDSPTPEDEPLEEAKLDGPPTKP
jgi:transcriptional regulator with GAF, ATPase, and Fis domain